MWGPCLEKVSSVKRRKALERDGETGQRTLAEVPQERQRRRTGVYGSEKCLKGTEVSICLGTWRVASGNPRSVLVE